jgi:hypothetical protein
VSAPVPPLLATVGINGKVSFLEKGNGTSPFQNSTGAYELDLSLVQNFSLAWREMHVKTDVFCSAAVVLPDKAARILNVGGYSRIKRLVSDFMPLTDRLASMARTTGRKIQAIFNFR